AGHDDDLRIFCQKHIGNLKAIAFDRACAFSSVRKSSGVADIQNFFAWEQIPQRFDDGQPADPGIENANRSHWPGMAMLAAAPVAFDALSLRNGSAIDCECGGNCNLAVSKVGAFPR